LPGVIHLDFGTLIQYKTRPNVATVLLAGFLSLQSLGCDRKPTPPSPTAASMTDSVVSSISAKPSLDDNRDAALTVMSWNLEWFFDEASQDNYSKLAIEQSAPSRKDWDWKRDAVAAAIAKVEPDVVGLQEIEGQKVLYYLTRAIEREHKLIYNEFFVEGSDFFTEQDVGLLVKAPVDVLAITKANVTSTMTKTKRFGSVSKHQMVLTEVPVGDRTEQILIVNVHLRAGADNDAIRAKQMQTVNEWIDTLYPQAGREMHLIVMGDFNTEQIAGQVKPESELGIMISRGTPTTDDDLIDLHESIPVDQRGTHLLPGRQFDRILVSRSLVEDDPSKPDLTLKDVTVRRDVSIQGAVDTQEEHWDNYWKTPEDQRDISDHYPVVARFIIQ
jgi:endonuclease/exonuclease/phosphatase family metal-dependent hydrolase